MVYTGLLVALFDPADASHGHCKPILATVADPLFTTVPVLTEAFHLLNPDSIGARRLMVFISARGLNLWYLDDQASIRALAWMVRYGDHPMDLAEASLLVLAETRRSHKVFTIDRTDFTRYRIQNGHQQSAFEILE